MLIVIVEAGAGLLLLVSLKLTSSQCSTPLCPPHLLLELLGKSAQHRFRIDTLVQLHVGLVAPFAPTVEVLLRGHENMVLHRAVGWEVFINALHGCRIAFHEERLTSHVDPSEEFQRQRGGYDGSAFAVGLPRQLATEAACADGSEGCQVGPHTMVLHHGSVLQKLEILRPATLLAHGFHLRHLGYLCQRWTIAHGSPREVVAHLRLHSEHAVGICNAGVIRAGVVHLRHQQVESRKGHHKSQEVQHRRRLESACHVKHVSYYVHHSHNLFAEAKLLLKHESAKT